MPGGVFRKLRLRRQGRRSADAEGRPVRDLFDDEATRVRRRDDVGRRRPPSAPDPVTNFLPEFAGLQVSVPKLDSTSGKLTYSLVSPDRAMTIQDLLRHTSGLVYGDFTSHAQVKEAYIKEVPGESHFEFA
jgi:hypothetical protein